MEGPAGSELRIVNNQYPEFLFHLQIALVIERRFYFVSRNVDNLADFINHEAEPG